MNTKPVILGTSLFVSDVLKNFLFVINSLNKEAYQLLKDLKESVENEQEEVLSSTTNSQYRLFQNNLSAYVDNELPQEENIKIKKFTINNKKARKELENTYSIRKLMNDSFQKTKSESRQDFSKNVMKQLDLSNDANLGFHPLLKVAIAFVMTVLVLSAIIVFSLTL